MDWIAVYREEDHLRLERMTNEELADDILDDKMVVLLVRNDEEGKIAMQAAEASINADTIMVALDVKA